MAVKRPLVFYPRPSGNSVLPMSSVPPVPPYLVSGAPDWLRSALHPESALHQAQQNVANHRDKLTAICIIAALATQFQAWLSGFKNMDLSVEEYRTQFAEPLQRQFNQQAQTAFEVAVYLANAKLPTDVMGHLRGASYTETTLPLHNYARALLVWGAAAGRAPKATLFLQLLDALTKKVTPGAISVWDEFQHKDAFFAITAKMLVPECSRDYALFKAIAAQTARAFSKVGLPSAVPGSLRVKDTHDFDAWQLAEMNIVDLDKVISVHNRDRLTVRRHPVIVGSAVREAAVTVRDWYKKYGVVQPTRAAGGAGGPPAAPAAPADDEITAFLPGVVFDPALPEHALFVSPTAWNALPAAVPRA